MNFCWLAGLALVLLADRAQAADPDEVPYRLSGASLTLGLGGRLVLGRGEEPLSSVGGALHALAGYYPAQHFGLRAGVRIDGGKGWGDDWCSDRAPCVVVGVQFAALAVVPISGPNRGLYVTGGVGLYQREWIFAPRQDSAQSPFTFKLGAGYKFPTSRDNAVDVFFLGELGRHTSFSYLEDGVDMSDEDVAIPWLGLELGVALDLGL